MPGSVATRSITLALGALLSLPVVSGAAELAECRDSARREGPGESASECYFLVSRDRGDLAVAARSELEDLARLHPEAPWPRFYLGRIPPWLDHGGPHLERAAELFEARGEVSAAIRARYYLVTWHMLWHSFEGRAADLAAATGHLAGIEALLQRSDSAQDRALADMARAHYLMLRVEDLEGAHLLLRGAYTSLTAAPEAHRHELGGCLRSLVDVCDLLGLSDEARHWAELKLELAIAEGRLRDQAIAGFDLVFNRLLAEIPREQRRRELLDDLHTTLEIAQRSGHAWIEAASRHLIAEIEGGSQAPAHLEKCAELAGTDNELRGRCLKAQATLRLEDDPLEARRLLDAASADEDQGPWVDLDSWEDQMRVVWATDPPERALQSSEVILSLFEALRRNQLGVASDRLLSASADAYYWLSGRLMLEAADRGRPLLGPAFSIIERLRAQTLREALTSRDEASGPPPPELSEALERIDRLYVEITRRLFQLDLDPAERDELLARLDELDREAAEIRRRSDSRDRDAPALRPPGPGLLDRVERLLRPDEAMLSFQLGLWEGWDRRFAGGSWLLVTTSRGSTPYRLDADRADLEPAVKALRARSDPEDPPALVYLHDQLLEPALTDLPAEVRKLILVPDGMLHLLPFSLLRAAENEPPLIERFELQIVPSAMVWQHWREGTPLPAALGGGVLVLANPLLQTGAQASGARAASLRSVATLGPLPYAEREGKRVLRHLGGEGRLERGEDASESLLKSADLAPYRILHFAAHAYLDLKRPGLSGVVLAAGADDEDGLLRPSEIARLEGLEDKLIVLAACNTAAGEVLRGEGVLSLARAFFEAGAESVVASLWRLDDRLATQFFDDFYRHLGDGISVGRALARTQSDWSRDGRPASTWAGLVVLGNGDFVPLPGGVRESTGGRWLVAAGLVGLLLIAGLALRR